MNIYTPVAMSLRFITAAAVVAACVAACGSNSTPSSTTSGSATAPAAAPILVRLGNQPSGTVALSWDPRTKNVNATLAMVGFTPGSSHAMHIHQGSCAAQGDVLIPFPAVSANGSGAIDTTVTSSQPAPAGLAAGTYLNIHLAAAPQLGSPTSLGYTPIACADITSSSSAATTLTMAPPPQPGQHPQGSATLTYDPAKKTLSVDTTASGLLPGSAHAEHIHLGSCAVQGAVTYPLNDLMASPTGNAEVTTVLQNVDQAPPASGWYVNVHLGSASQIQQPNGQPTLYFEPIICGDIGK